MAEIAGLGGSVKIGTSDTVASLKDWKLTIDGADLDTTSFGATFKTRIIGLKEWSATASGSFVVHSDTNGQTALNTALLAGTSVTLKLYVNSTNYYSGTAYIKKATVDTTVTDLVKIDFEFVGSGACSYN